MAEAVTVTLDAQPPGMVTLRGDLASEALRRLASDLAAAPFPERGEIRGTAARGLAWMSPDELLLILPRDDVAPALARIGAELAGHHHLAVDVSDLRALLRMDGAGAREVLAKLSPADLSPEAVPLGVLRRTRLGQVAAALWFEEEGAGGEGARVLCFRSVAPYARALLAQSARDGAVGYF